MVVHSMPMGFVVLPLALVDIAINVLEPPFSLSLVVLPITIILGTVWPYLLTSAVPLLTRPLTFVDSKVRASSAALNAAHLSATKRMCPLTILTVAFWIRIDAPPLQMLVCASPRTDTVTWPVWSPTTASSKLSDPATFSESLTHFTMRLTPLESGSMSFTLMNFGLVSGFFSSAFVSSFVSSFASSSGILIGLGLERAREDV